MFQTLIHYFIKLKKETENIGVFRLFYDADILFYCQCCNLQSPACEVIYYNRRSCFFPIRELNTRLKILPISCAWYRESQLFSLQQIYKKLANGQRKLDSIVCREMIRRQRHLLQFCPVYRKYSLRQWFAVAFRRRAGIQRSSHE